MCGFDLFSLLVWLYVAILFVVCPGGAWITSGEGEQTSEDFTEDLV